MEDIVIGIIGAGGLVGGEAVKTIYNFTTHKILMGGRNLDKMLKVIPPDNKRISYFEVDLFNDKQLQKFCSECSVVINCAGPAKKILDRIADKAISENVHYIDVSGDELLYNLIKKKEDLVKKKNLSFIIGAGLYPGLSEVFPAYIAEHFFDSIDNQKVYFTGNGPLSFNAAYDFVCSIEDSYSEGMAYFKNGNVEKCKINFSKKIKLPYINKELSVYPALTFEFRDVAQRYSMKEAFFFNTYENFSSLNTLINIKVKEKYKTEEEKKESAKLLIKAMKDFSKNNYTLFYIITEGIKDSKPISQKSTIYIENDGNIISGIIAGNTAKVIVEEKERLSGCFFLHRGVDLKKLVYSINENGIHIENLTNKEKAIY